MRLAIISLLLPLATAPAFAAEFKYSQIKYCLQTIQSKDNAGEYSSTNTRTCNDLVNKGVRPPVQTSKLGWMMEDGSFFILSERQGLKGLEIGYYEYNDSKIVFHKLHSQPATNPPNVPSAAHGEWILKNGKPELFSTSYGSPCRPAPLGTDQKTKGDKYLIATDISQTGVKEAQETLIQSIVLSLKSSQDDYNDQLLNFIQKKAINDVSSSDTLTAVQSRYQAMYSACKALGVPEISAELEIQNTQFQNHGPYVADRMTIPIDQRTLSRVAFHLDSATSSNNVAKPGVGSAQ